MAKSSAKRATEQEKTNAVSLAPESVLEDEFKPDETNPMMHKENPLIQECIQRTYVKAEMVEREHAEFHNCYSIESVIDDLKFLRFVYGERLDIYPEDVNKEFVESLTGISIGVSRLSARRSISLSDNKIGPLFRYSLLRPHRAKTISS